MNPRASFVSLASLKEPVNQWLCIAFISLWCFWTLLYYFTEKAQAVGANLASAGQEYAR